MLILRWIFGFVYTHRGPLRSSHLSRLPKSSYRILILSRMARFDTGVCDRLLYLRSTQPELELDGTVLEKQVDRTLTGVFRLIHWKLLIAQANQKGLSNCFSVI